MCAGESLMSYVSKTVQLHGQLRTLFGILVKIFRFTGANLLQTSNKYIRNVLF